WPRPRTGLHAISTSTFMDAARRERSWSMFPSNRVTQACRHLTPPLLGRGRPHLTLPRLRGRVRGRVRGSRTLHGSNAPHPPSRFARRRPLPAGRGKDDASTSSEYVLGSWE